MLWKTQENPLAARNMVALLLLCITLIAGACVPAAAPSLGSAPQPPSPSSSQPVPAPPVAATPQAPTRGGTLIVSLASDPPHFDVHQQATALTSVVTAPVYNKLLTYDPSTATKLVPDLAEKWEATPDGLSYRFTIRSNAKAHDGQTFSAEDAQFNIRLLAAPPQGTISNMSSLLAPVFKDVVLESERVVRVDFKEQYAPFLSLMSVDYAPMYPKRVVEARGDMKQTLLGTGPFQFRSYSVGVSIELTKNPSYWLAGRPYLDGVSFRIVKDASTRQAALRTGQVHVTGRLFSTLTPSQMETLKRETPNMNLFPSASLRGPWFFMNLRKPPFSDPRVRRAINLALDRGAAIKTIGEGFGLAGNFFPYEGWGLSQEDLAPRPGFRQPKDADMSEARSLLAAAGFPSGFTVNILSRTAELTKNSAVFMTGQLQTIGITANVQVLEDALFFDSGRRAQHEAMVYTPGATIPDPIWVGSFFVKGGSFNFSGNDADTRLNTLWVEQSRTLDETKRKSLVRQTEEYLWENLPAIPIVWPYDFLAATPQVRGFVRGSSDIAENSLQEVWLAR